MTRAAEKRNSVETWAKRVVRSWLASDLLAVIDTLSASAAENGTWYREYMLSNAPRIQFDARFVRRHISGPCTVLDIGAVPPLLSALLAKCEDFNISVLDLHASVFQGFFDGHGISWVEGDVSTIENAGFPEEGFDLVLLCEVLEHLSGDITRHLEKIANCVAPGGYLYLTTPNLRSLSGLIGLMFFGSGLASKYTQSVVAQYARASTEHGYLGHVREYTPKEVVALVERSGLRHVRSGFQADYRKRPGHLVVGAMERIMPSFRLFGKYLFQRPQ